MDDIPTLPIELQIQVIQSLASTSFESRSATLRRCALLNRSLRGAAQAELCRHAVITSTTSLHELTELLENSKELAHHVESLKLFGGGYPRLKIDDELARILRICPSLRRLGLFELQQVRIADVGLSKSWLHILNLRLKLELTSSRYRPASTDTQ